MNCESFHSVNDFGKNAQGRGGLTHSCRQTINKGPNLVQQVQQAIDSGEIKPRRRQKTNADDDMVEIPITVNVRLPRSRIGELLSEDFKKAVELGLLVP